MKMIHDIQIEEVEGEREVEGPPIELEVIVLHDQGEESQHWDS
jgi:hypothetical protein